MNETRGKLTTRTMSCTCLRCLRLAENICCLSSDYVSAWQKEDICTGNVPAGIRRKKTKKTVMKNMEKEENEPQATKKNGKQ